MREMTLGAVALAASLAAWPAAADEVYLKSGGKVSGRIVTRTDTQIEVVFDRRRPPLEAPPASLAFATHGQEIYKELGKPLEVATTSTGGGTDAAFAGLKARGAVVEGFGLRGFGAHSSNNEYILMESIEPRMYLAVRMIMDFARGKVPTQ